MGAQVALGPAQACAGAGRAQAGARVRRPCFPVGTTVPVDYNIIRFRIVYEEGLGFHLRDIAPAIRPL